MLWGALLSFFDPSVRNQLPRLRESIVGETRGDGRGVRAVFVNWPLSLRPAPPAYSVAYFTRLLLPRGDKRTGEGNVPPDVQTSTAQEGGEAL